VAKVIGDGVGGQNERSTGGLAMRFTALVISTVTCQIPGLPLIALIRSRMVTAMTLLRIVIAALLMTPVAFLSEVSAEERLSKEAATQLVAEKLVALQATRPRSALPDQLPESVQAYLAAGKRAQIRVDELDLGNDMKMKFTVLLRETVREKPPEPVSDQKRSLFIAMHGGGAEPKQPGPHTWEVNTNEFKAQIQLTFSQYKPDGVYFIPRMADDRLGRWWHKHNQVAFDLVIDHAIGAWNVDPNRVYLLGISEGGYGTDILAPFMADRLAGANAMAAGVGLGNPPINLRNLAFRTDVGELDMQFDRRSMAEQFHAELERLRQADPEGYVNSLNVQPGKGHGIDYSHGVQWIAKHTRNPWPEKVVWINQTMDGQRRSRFYWLAMPKLAEKGDVRVDAIANKTNNTITLEVATLDLANTDGNRTHGKDHVAEAKRTPLSNTSVDLLLHDQLIDLNQAITVIANGKRVFSGLTPRRADVIAAALAEQPDPSACPTAKISITTP
jgi:hypothetical protein